MSKATPAQMAHIQDLAHRKTGRRPGIFTAEISAKIQPCTKEALQTFADETGQTLGGLIRNILEANMPQIENMSNTISERKEVK